MLLSAALLALFMMGFWLYCLTDALLTPSAECRGMSKPAWIVVISLTFIGGAVAWLIVREPLRGAAASPAPPPDDPGDRYFRSGRWTDADDAVARHPAGRAKTPGGAAARGPDDDPAFLRALDRAIRGNSQAGGEILAAVPGRARPGALGKPAASAGLLILREQSVQSHGQQPQ
jgi:hypothetical protein